MTRWIGVVLLTAVGLCDVQPACAADERWVEAHADAPRIVLYYFWSPTCRHCQTARPFVDALAKENAWIVVKDLEVVHNADNRHLYQTLAESLGQDARSVPGFIFCGEMVTGFDNAEGVGAFLKVRLAECRDRFSATNMVGANSPSMPLGVPFLGPLHIDDWSLPALTLMLAGLDSFNPCAMFVLLFLMTLLVHAKSRARMLVVGGTFVAVSGLAYFAFMAAWLNLFLIVGELAWITFAAGILALAIGAVNVKDYFWLDRGVSVSISSGAKLGLLRRMRNLVGADRLLPLVGGTLVLAVVANAYELLCTAGFPMIFTRVLTLSELPTSSYYLYLLAYNLIYVLPLLLIVVLFVVAFTRRKLSETEGRTLKLLSGLMMLGLGSVLILAPTLLSSVLVAVGLLVGAVAVTTLVRWLAPPKF
jgi:thiol-disulfide isomerase/thioredoxin